MAGGFERDGIPGLGIVNRGSNYWTAAVTKHSQEQRAAHHIERQGFEFYLPETIDVSPRGVERPEYMFPGYIFIKISEGWRSLLGTRGISRMMLSTSEKPSRIQDHEIERLRQRENKRGFIELPEPFERGQAIMLNGGVFYGFSGIVAGMPARNRVNVLLKLLGRAVEIEVDRRIVAVA